ncbi:MAG: HD domain-containing protein [Bacteroidales bacterium]|nr:HD domain-containing protein [Bacteroidales bacterium]
MKTNSYNKLKIINDPVYGFINIPSELHFDIIQHPYFQRLRRIKQLGLSNYVYPGATHTRFDHVLGAMHLMNSAVLELRKKGHKSTDEERMASLTAILLHDIGHGPYSHTLEGTLMKNVTHEDMSLLFMEKLNAEFNGEISMGIEIFNNTYSKKFLHKLVSSQLDTDRLDYLKRDSFFTGVTEGGIGTDRIIKMLNVVDDKLVIEEKGIYSAEQFLVARRIMYWQVYLHKTVIAAEEMLKKAIKRAKEESQKNGVFASPALGYFFDHEFNGINEIKNKPLLPYTIEAYTKLDDSDIIVSLKEWMNHSDKILSEISKRLINRNLFHVDFSNKPFDQNTIIKLKEKASVKYKIPVNDADYFVFSDRIKNKAYNIGKDNQITVLMKNGKTADIAEASDLSNIIALSQTVEKYYLCYPKNIV